MGKVLVSLCKACIIAAGAIALMGCAEDVFVDSGTSLMWQAKDNGAHNWYEAMGFEANIFNSKKTNICGDLEYGGYSDWRMPTLEELDAITDKSKSPTVKDGIGIKIKAVAYWSSTRVPNTGDFSWVMNFLNGKSKDHAQSAENKVLCLRANR
jgi:hypothetical protein